MAAGFRFPPFPLAVAEQPASTISTEPELDTDTNIFEAKSPEYCVYERIPQPSADILTQVARSLPALLPEPDINFDSIFEDKSHHDYTVISTISSPPITSTQSLEMLVADKKYDEALRVLDELLEVGTEIPFSFSYEKAAIAALKVTAQTVAEMDHQIQTFRKWFSLIPRADQSRPRSFHRLVDRIMLSPLNSLRLIMEFGLVAAEKGFISSTLHRVTSVVSMYGDPDIAIQYIDELRRRNRTFLEQSLKDTGADVDGLDRKFHAGVVGVAVRTLASAGRLEHAVRLIPDPLKTIFHLTPYTYNFLIRKLESTQDSRYLPHINFIAQHKSETRYRSTGLRRMPTIKLAMSIRCLVKVGEFDLADFAENVSLFSSVSPRRMKQDLATALRALKDGFRALSPSRRPHPLTVVHFIERYLSSGRTRAIPLLRNCVLRSTVGSSSYILAEMLFHARRGNPDLVIRTFVTHFYVVGVPRDELLLRMDAMETPESPDIWAARPQVKLYPDTVHAAVVWRALLEVSEDERSLEGLYSKLLKFADLKSTATSVLHPSVPYLHPPPAWKTGVAASAFTPFIRRMCYAFGAERGALVLKDMFKIGIMPTIYQLTEIAMEYSRTGDVTRTFSLLDQVEFAAKDWDKKHDNETVRRRAQDLIPRVDRVFYIAIIRGFLRSDKISAAREVERRMFQRYGYVRGKSQYLDDLYTDLQTAERADNFPSRLVRAITSYYSLLLTALSSSLYRPECITLPQMALYKMNIRFASLSVVHR
ncbi:hypothetical protein GGX14DRAFT_363000 [Mycena pura]|uniref:Uncharacterized protein n=1 Tax=Mycena pura TaxID=153505 RepID=A0AAD6VIZ6_9AGAR|nr:hypothetical protein GGX14DRAFT_363000 [Mycena pura]